MPTVRKQGPPDVPKPPRGPRRRARDAVLTVLVAVGLLALFEGPSVRAAGEEMQPGWERSVVLAVGRPTGWFADLLPLHKVDLFGWIGADEGPGGGRGFDTPAPASEKGGIPPVSPDSFDPGALGAKPRPHRPLHTVLVTGDSMPMPLDVHLARKLAGGSVKVLREPHIGTGVSKSGFVDWGKLSSQQVKKDKPDAVVVFIGANEGFPLKGPGGRQVQCCGPDWAAIYAFRVRRMMSTYRQRGEARVYWLTLPLPREHARQVIAHSVNAAIDVASVPYRSTTRILDMEPVFTPGGRYRDSMDVGGRKQIVRDPDGIHLNDAGAEVAARIVLAAIRRDFGK
jgi:lysophospholipase L1-like esterase